MPKAKQEQLAGVNVEPDEVGVCAETYLDRLDDVDTAKEKAQTARDALVAIMRDKRRREIHVKGVTVLLRHMDAQDIIKVKKSKQP